MRPVAHRFNMQFTKFQRAGGGRNQVQLAVWGFSKTGILVLQADTDAFFGWDPRRRQVCLPTLPTPCYGYFLLLLLLQSDC